MRGRRPFLCLLAGACWAAAFFLPRGTPAVAADLTAKQVADSIERGKRFLVSAQDPDGWWELSVNSVLAAGEGKYRVGTTSLVLLALLNTGMTVSDPEIQRGLAWLRKQKSPEFTYEISLMIQALAAAKDDKRDVIRVVSLVADLEEMQIREGPRKGCWTYSRTNKTFGGDRSNAQFAVLALREAQEMGVPVDMETWRRARQHWLISQNPDGGWGYSDNEGYLGGRSYGSMTVAGIATLVITEAMLRAEEKELNADGTPICCAEHKPDKRLEDAFRWLGDRFQVAHNPGGDGNFLLYYLYGLERAGRFSGRRFFVSSKGDHHDWYRAGAEYLVHQQTAGGGAWKGGGWVEHEPVLATSFALMFLSKGLAPVLFNKLEYGPREADGKTIVGHDWNLHKDDVRHLTQQITNLPKWPRLLNWQTVDVSRADVADLMQAPIVFFSGSEAPKFAPPEVALLKEYVQQGGCLFAVNNCRSAAFDEGFRDLVRQMYPPGEAQLKRLTGEHPVFRSEFNLLDDKGEATFELWGVDVGCRTSVIYSPSDLSCLWDKWTSFEIPGRSKELEAMITRATRVGVNVVAYVTGREILNKLDQQEQQLVRAGPGTIERDRLQIVKIKYAGDWDPAPLALRNLLVALNRTSGAATTTAPRELTLLNANLFRYPIAWMHGRHEFNLPRNEQDKLRDYINQGGVLVADACCGLPAFDRSFRRLLEQLYPDRPLKRIPVDHELFSTRIGNELKTVKRRERDVDNPKGALAAQVREVEPFLEGLEIDGRFVVIYSKYDLSCALQRQSSVTCSGYLHEDAIKLGVNVILYALLQ